jgi:drug/metabolite transporter (DMT)-like permease
MAFCFNERLTGLPGNAWVKIIALTIGAQLLGHTVFNRVLKTTSPTVVSVTILLEVPSAALIAEVWLGQIPSWTAIPGAAMIFAGLIVVATSAGDGGTGSVEGVAEAGLESRIRSGPDHLGVGETAQVTGQ